MSQNLLAGETSPYLLQHQHNPVHWRPWGPAALAEAEATGKPILLSVGYAACHWCHVMAHESFEDEPTAAVMNRLFINIKVDREERPDVDQIYMAALHALGEQGGWPLTMFLTPAGEPIWGGTYFPKTPGYGRPAFTDLLEEVARLYREEPDKIARNRAYIMNRLTAPKSGDSVALDRPLLDEAASRLLGIMDPVHGGTRGAPKFPQASLLAFLWRAGARTGDPRYGEAVLRSLTHISQGGIYDHVGGGFSRYSVDERWLAPHFEKMLYDNAQLIELLAAAHAATGEALFRLRIEETVGWLVREMRQEGGAFAASLDADSEGHEGKFYVWSHDELLAVLGPEAGAFFAAVYDITPGGNWEGTSIPNRLHGIALRPAADEERLSRARAALLVVRARRQRPATDDKILADWNGLLIAALADAGARLARPDWIALAEDAFRFIDGQMRRDDRLAHSHRAGRSLFPGLATDYAAMTKGALALHAATLDRRWIAVAEDLAATLRNHHWDDERPGYFLSADDAEALIMRPRSSTDEATPSADSLMAENLVRIWRLTAKDDYRRDADALLAASAPAIAANLFATVGLLNGLDFRLGATDVIIVGEDGPQRAAMVAAARKAATANTVIAVHDRAIDLPDNHPAAGKIAVGGKPTAYVCHGETCSLPITDAGKLAAAIRG